MTGAPFAAVNERRSDSPSRPLLTRIDEVIE